MRLLVTGAAGQLGRVIAERFSRSATVVAVGRSELDVTDVAQVRKAVASIGPDAIVNCSAYNRVDDAEAHPTEALAVNSFGVLALARAAREARAVFVHYGTDFVFDGRADRPYVETDRPRPESNYAMSKLLGEWFAADAGDHYVLRVESLFGGERAKSSVDRILDAIRTDQPAVVFTDRTVTPSYVDDIAEATARLLEDRPASGTYHCVNTGVTTWFGVGQELARLVGRDARLVPTSVESVAFTAKRPKYCALSNDKLAGVGIAMPAWQDALARYVAKITLPRRSQ
jgi:dTDP-4-dehydrorhamnose reductase